MDWKAKNQKNKAIVWEYWQRINSAAPNEVKGIFQKTFHKEINWNGSQPFNQILGCLLYTSPSPRDRTRSRMPSSA